MLNQLSFRKTVVAFTVGAVIGVCIPMLLKWVTGRSDPFQAGWPLFLPATVCFAAIAISSIGYPALTSAFGLFTGLVVYLLAFENPEYPVTSLIALAIHGLIPALIGSLVAIAFRRRTNSLSKSRHDV